MRKLALALACASILGTSNAQAMGLGEVVVRSYLNQPLLAEIPVVDVAGQPLEGLRARLGDAQAFERQGYALRAVAGRIQVQLQGGKQPRIVLTSKAPMQDPVLGVVVELEGPDGVIQRGYDILLDPVSYRAPRPTVNVPVAVAPAVGSGPTLQGSVEDGHYRVREGETLWRVAYNLRPPGVSTEQMMAALREANPRAFAGPGKNDALLSGALLRIPDTEEILRARERKKDVPPAKKAPVQEAAPVAKVAAEASAEPKVAIVAPAQPVPAVVSPVVGEVVSSPATGSAAADVAEGEAVHLREQLEAAKVEKEQLLQRVGSIEAQMAKMEELLRLKDEQIRHLEHLLQAGGAVEKAAPVEQPAPVQPPAEAQPAPVKPVAPPVEAVKPPAAPVAAEQEGGLLSLLTQPAVLGAGGVAALLLALLLGRVRRRREQAQAQSEPVVPLATAATPPPQAQPLATEVVVPAAAATATLAAAELAPEPTSVPAVDPVQSTLEEVDVLQAYGLHDRARALLDEAIGRLPEADVLQARRVRLFHEMGAREEFLAAAEAYRQAHPAVDDPHWSAIAAIGQEAYADAPLFGGQPAVAAEAQAEPAHELPWAGLTSGTTASEAPNAAWAQAESTLEPQVTAAPVEAGWAPLELPEVLMEPTATPAAEPLAQPLSSAPEAHLEPLTLEWPALETVESKAAEPEPLPPLDLQALSLEWVTPSEAPAPAPTLPEAPEARHEPEPLSLELPPAEAEEPVLGLAAPDTSINEDDLRLLGLDDLSLDTTALELPELGLAEEPQPQPTSGIEPLPIPEPALAPAPLSTIEEQPQALVPPQGTAIDERAVKLDMAEALLELGDVEGARALLEEVVSGADDHHAERARAMLARTAV